MEQGGRAEAEAVLYGVSTPEPLPRAGYWASLLGSRARLLALQGRRPGVKRPSRPRLRFPQPMKPCCASQSRATCRCGLPCADFCRFSSAITSLVRAAEIGTNALAMFGSRS
jgi:hypothetical protein